MRLLLDENLSPRLPRLLAGVVEAVHVRDIGLRGRDDLRVWEHERANAMVIVSKDWDFVDLAAAQVPPPWVVHLDIGNCTVAQSAAAIRAGLAEIFELCRGDATAWTVLARAGSD